MSTTLPGVFSSQARPGVLSSPPGSARPTRIPSGLALLAVLLLLCTGTSGCDDTPGDTDMLAGDGASADGTGDVPLSDVPGDAPDATTPDGSGDTPSPNDSATETSTPGDTVPDGPSCVTDRVLLVEVGTTSACSFEVPVPFDRGAVNVVFSHGWDEQLCRQGSHNCMGGGWFWIEDKVALCDLTCAGLDSYPNGRLYVELGCPTESCTAGCIPAGDECPIQDADYCCIGNECIGGVCRGCTRAGASCSSSSQCCEGGTCTDGMCVSGVGGQCVDDIGCTLGTCNGAVCSCGPDMMDCGGECVSRSDTDHCGDCTTQCQADEACVYHRCVCDPDGPTPDECDNTCVDTASDDVHCGGCWHRCSAYLSCIDSECRCPDGLTECGSSCVDVQTSLAHCGGCDTRCPYREVCTDGACVCGPEYTDCDGSCINLQTDHNNCGACGEVCKGNKPCVAGECG